MFAAKYKGNINCGDIKFVFFTQKKNRVKEHTRNHGDTLFELANW